MCHYSYVYYTKCRHGELTRKSFCEKALALGLHRAQDGSSGNDNNPGSSADDRSSVSGSSAPILTPTSDAQQSGDLDPSLSDAQQLPISTTTSGTETSSQRPMNMSLLASSEAGPVESWIQAAATAGEESPGSAALVPRSVHNDIATASSFTQSPTRDYPQRASQGSSSLDTEDYNNLNISIPLEPHSGFSMKFTNDGEVQQIVTRFESLALGDGSNAALSDDVRVPTGNTPARTLSAPTVHPSDSGTDTDTDTETVRDMPTRQEAPGQHSSQVGRGRAGSLADVPTISRRRAESDVTKGTIRAHTLSKKNTKGKQVLSNVSGTEDEAEQANPRKPIPTHWTGKTHGPSLATAQRAMQRESRKNASKMDSPTEASRKSIRGARTSAEPRKAHGAEATTFLTKDSTEPIESELTRHQVTRSPDRLRQAQSKTSLKSPVVSPVRDSPGRSSTIQITVSPKRGPAKAPVGSGQGLVVDSRPSSTAGFATARESPVSQASVLSFHTAPSGAQDDITELDLTNDGDKQKAKRFDGMNSPHSRGRSEPHVKVPSIRGKATSMRPLPPALSLRIPQSSSLSTDRKSPLSLDSAGSSGSGTPASPVLSSRIPRMSSTAAIRKLHHGEPEGMCNSDSVDPRCIPLPETPIMTAVRHVRTLNGDGATPILSRASPEFVDDETETPTGPRLVSQSENNVAESAPTDTSPAQAALGKHEMVESYLQKTVPVPALKSPTIANRTPDAYICRYPSESGSVPFPEKPADSEPEHHADKEVQSSGSGSYGAHHRVSRVTSTSSDATVKAPAPALPKDPVMDDSAIIYSRRKSDASFSSSLTSGLRPEADVFVPQQQNVQDLTAASDDLGPPQYLRLTNLQGPIYDPNTPFDPFALDTYGVPMYHHMYPIPVGPGTPYDFRSFFPYTSPSKKAKNKKPNGTPKNTRKNRGDTTSYSPTKSRRAEDESADKQDEQPGSEETGSGTPRPLNPYLADPTSASSEDNPVQASVSHTEKDPAFAQQVESIPRTNYDQPTGRGSRRIDWTTIRNVPYRPREQQGAYRPPQVPQQGGGFAYAYGQSSESRESSRYSHHTLPFAGQQNRSRPRTMRPDLPQFSNNGLYENRHSGGYRNRNWNYSAGVPLDDTAPFPNPVPPRGPMPTKGEAAASVVDSGMNRQVGHGDKEPKGCGKMVINDCMEWNGNVCNKCDPHPQH